MTGSLHDAGDLVQETCLRAWKAYDRFEGKSSDAPDCTGSRPTPVWPRWRAVSAGLIERTEVPWLEPLPDLAEDPANPSVVVGSR